MTAATAPSRLDADRRAASVRDAFDRCRQDGALLVVHHSTGDLLVDGGPIRDVEHVLAAHAAEQGMGTGVYTIAGLARALVAPGGPAARIPVDLRSGTPPTIALDQLRDACLQADGPQVLVLDFAEHLVPPGAARTATGDVARIVEQIAWFARDPGWRASGHRVVLVARTAVLDPMIARLPGVAVLDLGLPAAGERRAALARLIGSATHPLQLPEGLGLDDLARLTGGVTVAALSELRYRTSTTAPLRIEDVIARKRAAIRAAAGDTLSVHDAPLDLAHDVAGVPQVHRLLAEETRRGSSTLRVILAGSPGNGKTRVSTAIADALRVPAIELGRIRARYVGDSEDNMRRALDVLTVNAPLCLVLDECDQAGLGRRGEVGAEGSEVTANLRAALFSWLGDVGEQQGVSVIGLTNRPDLLDEAALDRFTVLPVLHPSAWEAAEIMAIQARRQGLDLDVDGAALAVLESGATMSGRQAVRLLGRAHVHAVDAGRSRIGSDDVAAALAESMDGISAEDERQALLAIRATSFAGHLPWNAARYLGDASAQPPAHLAPFVLPDGRVDRRALTRRIGELEVRGAA